LIKDSTIESMKVNEVINKNRKMRLALSLQVIIEGFGFILGFGDWYWKM
jgi:hypothetical protein